MTLDISFGKHRTETNWKVEYLEWEEFVDRLRKIRRTPETMAQYDKMDNIRRQKVKDGPGFVGGFIRGGRRKKENVDTRSLITLDADHADNGFIFASELVLGGYAYVIYSTHSHRPEKQKYRLIVPTGRSMNPDEYAAVSRKLAEQIGLEYFDKTTFQVHRLMYLPSCSKDAKSVLEIYEGKPLSVDTVLAEYEDWQDPLQWPRHEGDKAQRQATKKMEDPRTKQGAVGVFCRCYSISEAIATFLPDVYEPTDESLTRYTYAGASSYGGLVVYDEDTFAYSHHESDPCSGREVNAFDLVRIHKFGKLDEGVDEKTDIRKKPSFKAMKYFVGTLDTVRELIQAEGSARLQAEFEDEIDIPDDEEETNDITDLSKVKIPTGFKVINGKIFEVKELKNEIKHVPVCDWLVLITERYTNLTDGTQGLGITWKIGDSVRTVFNTRSTFMDSKKIINLSDYGLPVHSGNARALASYLSRFESENENTLASSLISNQLGWVKGGFLLGDNFIGEGGIQFHPKDGGDEQTAKGFHINGTLEGTYQVLKQVKSYVPVKMAIYAALSAPVLSLWKENPYIFELAGGTSKGKTTALRIAASLFGCPDEQKPGFFKQWNLTKVYIERYAATMNSLPLFIDDTKKADPRIIPPAIYQFCSGQGRGRGSLKGAQAGLTWCTVLLSTGEQTLSSYSKDGGAVGRILSLYGSPFLSTDLETGKITEELNRQVSDNYGHIIEPWIRYLMTADLKKWKKKSTSINDVYREMARGHGEVAMRLSQIMAILDVTGQMFDDCFGLQLHNEEELRREWIKILTGATEIDRALESLEDVMGWVAAHHRQFIVGDEGTHLGPVLSGRIKKNEIIIIGEQLDSYLQFKGYEPTSTTKAWKEKGWLNTEEGRTKKKVRLAGGFTRAYAFNLDKIGWAYNFEKDYSEFGEDQ